MTNARIVWASDAATHAARHVSEVRTGLACSCVCPGCGAILEAVNAENPLWRRRPHFRHYELAELSQCAPQAFMAGAREALRRVTEIALPEVRAKRIARAPDQVEFEAEAVCPAQHVAVEGVELVDAADAILTLAGGERIYVRLVATARRPSDVKQTILSEVLIDISDPVLRTADPEILRRHITLDVDAKQWCNHMREPDLVSEADGEARLRAAKYWDDRIAQREAEERASQRVADRLAAQQAQIGNLVPTHDHPLKPVTRVAQGATTSTPGYSGPVDYAWARVAPHSGSVDHVVTANTQIWPKWDWRAIMAFGETCRRQGKPVDAAIQEALDRFRFSPTNPIVRTSWARAGLLAKVPKNTSGKA